MSAAYIKRRNPILSSGYEHDRAGGSVGEVVHLDEYGLLEGELGAVQ